MVVFPSVHLMVPDLSLDATVVVAVAVASFVVTPLPEHPESFDVVAVPVSLVQVTVSAEAAEAVPGTVTTAAEAEPARAAAQIKRRPGRRKLRFT